MSTKLLVPIILVGFIAAGCNKAQPVDNQNSSNSTSNPVNILHETYANTKYGYSFKFPSSYKVETFISTEGGQDLPNTTANSDSNPVVVSNEEGVSYMAISAFNITQPLSKDSIKDDFATEPENISKITIAGGPSFKVTFSEASNIPHDIYILQKSNNLALEIKIRRNDTISSQMLNSFQFTK